MGILMAIHATLQTAVMIAAQSESPASDAPVRIVMPFMSDVGI